MLTVKNRLNLKIECSRIAELTGLFIKSCHFGPWKRHDSVIIDDEWRENVLLNSTLTPTGSRSKLKLHPKFWRKGVISFVVLNKLCSLALCTKYVRSAAAVHWSLYVTHCSTAVFIQKRPSTKRRSALWPIVCGLFKFLSKEGVNKIELETVEQSKQYYFYEKEEQQKPKSLNGEVLQPTKYKYTMCIYA